MDGIWSLTVLPCAAQFSAVAKWIAWDPQQWMQTPGDSQWGFIQNMQPPTWESLPFLKVPHGTQKDLVYFSEHNSELATISPHTAVWTGRSRSECHRRNICGGCKLVLLSYHCRDILFSVDERHSVYGVLSQTPVTI